MWSSSSQVINFLSYIGLDFWAKKKKKMLNAHHSPSSQSHHIFNYSLILLHDPCVIHPPPYTENAPDEAVRWLLSKIRAQPPTGLGLHTCVKLHETSKSTALYISAPSTMYVYIFRPIYYSIYIYIYIWTKPTTLLPSPTVSLFIFLFQICHALFSHSLFNWIFYNIYFAIW